MLELEKLCQEPEAQAKIEISAAGILRKNYKFVHADAILNEPQAVQLVARSTGNNLSRAVNENIFSLSALAENSRIAYNI